MSAAVAIDVTPVSADPAALAFANHSNGGAEARLADAELLMALKQSPVKRPAKPRRKRPRVSEDLEKENREIERELELQYGTAQVVPTSRTTYPFDAQSPLSNGSLLSPNTDSSHSSFASPKSVSPVDQSLKEAHIDEVIEAVLASVKAADLDWPQVPQNPQFVRRSNPTAHTSDASHRSPQPTEQMLHDESMLSEDGSAHKDDSDASSNASKSWRGLEVLCAAARIFNPANSPTEDEPPRRSTASKSRLRKRPSQTARHMTPEVVHCASQSSLASPVLEEPLSACIDATNEPSKQIDGGIAGPQLLFASPEKPAQMPSLSDIFAMQQSSPFPGATSWPFGGLSPSLAANALLQSGAQNPAYMDALVRVLGCLLGVNAGGYNPSLLPNVQTSFAGPAQLNAAQRAFLDTLPEEVRPKVYAMYVAVSTDVKNGLSYADIHRLLLTQYPTMTGLVSQIFTYTLQLIAVGCTPSMTPMATPPPPAASQPCAF